MRSSKYNFLQPVIEQVNKKDIPKALNYCSDIAESLVGEVGNREAIWVNGEKSVIKTAIMAVVIDNAEDKVSDEKIRILYRDEIELEEKKIEEENRILEAQRQAEVANADINDVSEDDVIEVGLNEEYTKKINELNKKTVNLVSYTNRYLSLSQEDKDKMREGFFTTVLEKSFDFICLNCTDILYFKAFFEEKEFKNGKEELVTFEQDKVLSLLREELYYNLENFINEINKLPDTPDKDDLKKLLRDWKVLNDLRPHPEFQNIPNAYNFISKMCAEQEDKTMLMDTYIDSLPTNSPIVQQFAPAKIAPSKTRASFFTSALATLNVFVDDYVANMINEAEIDVNKFNEEKTALFMILPDEKTTFYGLCSLFVNQAYTKLCELADAKGRKT